MTDDMNPAPDVDGALDLLRQAVADANEASVAANTGTELALLNEDATAVKNRLASAHLNVQKARQTVVAAQQRVKDEVERARRHAQELARRLEEELAPLQEQVARFQDGIAAVNLYLGRDEHIVSIRDGRPADAETPVHVRQSVLAMDEEAALVDLNYGGIDFDNIDEFDAWLVADPSHVDQVLPEQRGVVAIMARRAYVDYGNPWENDARNEQNRQTWFLIRNGENLYRVLADGFSVGSRLVPREDEFTRMFLRFDGTPMQPGGSEWLSAEKSADLRTRHFMKIALVLQGLVARTAVFHPLPVAGLNLLTHQHYEDGHVRIIADDDHAIDTGRPSFDAWLREVNARLRVGVRIIGDFGSYHSRNTHWKDRSRSHPKYISGTPDKHAVHVLARMGAPSEYAFAFEYQTKRYDRMSNLVEVTDTATWRVHPEDHDFLAIDFINPDDIRYYLESRSERRSYLKSFPLLRAALAFIDREAAEEAPFRVLLRSEVAKAVGADTGDVDELADDLIRWWKVSNKWHRALKGDQEAEAKAARSIVAEAKRRKKAEKNAHVEDALVADILRTSENIVAVARRTTDWVAVEAIRNRYFTSKGDTNRYGHSTVRTQVFANLRFYNRHGELTETREWVTISRAQSSRWHLLHSTDDWENWPLDARADRHLTDSQIDTFTTRVLDGATARGLTVLGIQMEETPDSDFKFAQGYVYAAPKKLIWPVEGAELTCGASRSFHTDRYHYTISHDGSVNLYESASTGDHWWRKQEHSPFADERATDTEPAGTVMDPWSRHSHGQQMVWLSEDLPTYRDEYLRWVEADTIRAGLAHEADRLSHGLSDAWVDREMARAHARFIEDYGDESLWEDHQKSIQIVTPFRHTKWNWSPIDAAVARKVEAREDISGALVEDVVDADVLDERLIGLRFPELPPTKPGTAVAALAS